jgi:alkanesulfonate monooxygenase SsuD/methylene tetrahydromethanopterin reductase-like flavin-dependent oxidoreductase (luciferase family)
VIEIGLGVFSGECLPIEEKSPTAVLRDSIAQMQLAEAVGLDAIWITEHHFLSSGYVGSVLPYAAAAAQATEHIRIGVSVALAPLYDPVRLAEDAAFVDVLSGGRHDLGIALGYRDVEYSGFGVERRDRVGRMEELVALLRQSWGDGQLDFDGVHFQRHGVEVFPKPVQQGGVPVLMGGHAPAALDRTARLADAFIMDGGTDSSAFGTTGRNRDLFERVEATLAMYRDALQRHGRDTNDIRMYLTLGGFLHEDGPDAAWAELQDSYMYTRRVYADWYGLPSQHYASWYPDRMSDDEHAQRRSEVVLGCPDDMVATFRRLHDIVGDGLHVMFRCKYPGISDESTRRSITLLGELRDRLRR